MYAYFFTSDGRRVRVWQECVRGMPLLRLETPVKLNQRRCRRIRRWLKRCGVHRLLNRPAHWPESEPLPPLIGTRELWITKAPETALALLAQAGISPAQARVEFCSDRFTPELADTAMALAPLSARSPSPAPCQRRSAGSSSAITDYVPALAAEMPI